MSEEWDAVTKIGSKTRGGGASQRETVVRGNAALNAAKRSGSSIGTEKKFSTGNQVRRFPIISPSRFRTHRPSNTHGRGAMRIYGMAALSGRASPQMRLYRIKQLSSSLPWSLKSRRPAPDKGRPQRRHHQAQHGGQGGRRRHQRGAAEDGAQDDAEGPGHAVQHDGRRVGEFERGSAVPDQKVISAMERVLNVKLRGQGIGEPKFKPKGK
ncbi:hypothetical protein CHU98_g1981 [Xylaria longipes]|nr:hypothetical protein CHU98_g1981 [Xylaria longipes]